MSSAPEMAPRSFGTATAAPPFCARSLSRALYTVCRPFVFWVLFWFRRFLVYVTAMRSKIHSLGLR